MAKREYILASEPVTWAGGRVMREVKERIDGGPWRAAAVVENECAIDVLEALRRGYQNGREDHAEDYPPGGQLCTACGQPVGDTCWRCA